MIIADPGREHEAATRLGRIGFDHVVGYLADGLHSLESRPDLTRTTERLSAQVASERAGGGCTRSGAAARRRACAAASASRSASAGASAFRSIISASGWRSCRPIVRSSSTARAAIDRRLPRASCSVSGFTQVSEIAGGITAWEAANAADRSGRRPLGQNSLAFVNVELPNLQRSTPKKSCKPRASTIGNWELGIGVDTLK